MEQAEIEMRVGGPEPRVARLRALYDQYFMGIEKLEPTVPKKDVERRFQQLRKEQIRNTALRFKFQTIMQRYNTYQTYWMRICRQTREGTYRGHVMPPNAGFAADRPRPSQRQPDQAAEEPTSQQSAAA